uniref:AP2/ERF domain-containing protein n=1 Tax=Physcomitrium patens TaxID=3218 RepID=A0A2K1IS96_PHYPA|nr:hypothetical protein PHYPA_026276 [Physcomitrium patens]
MPGMAPAAWCLGGVKLERLESTEMKKSIGVHKIRKDMEDRDIDLNVPYMEEKQEQEQESTSVSASVSASSTSAGTDGKSCRVPCDEVHYRGVSGREEEVAYRGVRHRPELNKWVTEIRPTAQKRKIWLGTYKTAEEAARAYDVGIFYTGKKIPLNFPDSMENLPELPCGSWEEIAPFVKKQAVSAAKRHRGL